MAEAQIQQRRIVGQSDQALVGDGVGVALLGLAQPEGLRIGLIGGNRVLELRIHRLVRLQRGMLGVGTRRAAHALQRQAVEHHREIRTIQRRVVPTSTVAPGTTA
jgi:hypothetical protein